MTDRLREHIEANRAAFERLADSDSPLAPAADAVLRLVDTDN